MRVLRDLEAEGFMKVEALPQNGLEVQVLLSSWVDIRPPLVSGNAVSELLSSCSLINRWARSLRHASRIPVPVPRPYPPEFNFFLYPCMLLYGMSRGVKLGTFSRQRKRCKLLQYLGIHGFRV